MKGNTTIIVPMISQDCNETYNLRIILSIYTERAAITVSIHRFLCFCFCFLLLFFRVAGGGRGGVTISICGSIFN